MTERVRQKVVPNGTSLYGTYYITGTTQHGFSPVPPNYCTLVGTNTTESITTTDVSTPGFHKKMREGIIINNPFKRIHVKSDSDAAGPLVHEYHQVGGVTCGLHTPTQTHDKYHKTSGVWRPSSPAYIVMTDQQREGRRQIAIDQAVTQASANIDESEILALATIAESGKTVDSIRNILWRAFKIARAVRKLDGKYLAKELSPKELADRYMEARYAIRPLIYDVKGILASVEKRQRKIRKTYRGYGSAEKLSQKVVHKDFNIQLIYAVGDFENTLEHEVTARAGILCDVDVTQANIIGATQILETGWELLPFSFIIDWFANVGETIAANTPNAGVQQLASWVTYSERLVLTRKMVGYRSTATNYGFKVPNLVLSPWQVVREELVLERRINPIVSMSPRVDLRLDMYKLTDLAIILRKVFS